MDGKEEVIKIYPGLGTTVEIYRPIFIGSNNSPFKISQMTFSKRIFSIAIFLFTAVLSQAQPNKPYYNYNSDYSQQMRDLEKTRIQQAATNNTPNTPSGNKSGSTIVNSQSSQSSWGDGGAYQRRQDAYAKRAEARTNAYNASLKEFERLSKNVPKNKENYWTLVNLAVQAGFSYYVAYALNAAYDPYATTTTSSNTTTTYQQKYVAPDVYPPAIYGKAAVKYNEMLEKAEKARVKKDIPKMIAYLEQAYELYNDPYIMDRIGDRYYEIGDYNNAMKAYLTVERSPVTKKPSANSTSGHIGKSCLMQNNLDDAIKHLEKAYKKEAFFAAPLSYAYYLKADDVNAFRIINETIKEFSLTPQNKLIQSYFLLKNKKFDEAIEILDKVKPEYEGVTYVGDLYKDLAAIMCKSAEVNLKNWDNRYVNPESLYVLDIAIYLDPENAACIKLRKELNDMVKRPVN